MAQGNKEGNMCKKYNLGTKRESKLQTVYGLESRDYTNSMFGQIFGRRFDETEALLEPTLTYSSLLTLGIR